MASRSHLSGFPTAASKRVCPAKYYAAPQREQAHHASRGASREDGGAHGRLDHELQQLGRARLPVVDELCFPPLDADGARLLFQVASQAYESQSVVFTTHLEFSR